jgi:putative peptidoglycan lipid II flippase
MSTKRSLIHKALQVGGSTMASRLLGMVREILQAKYLGAGPLAEAFITAFKIPNSLRKIFAEGALSAAFIPTFVKLGKKDGKKSIDQLMSLALLLFEGVLALICIFVIWKAEWVIRVIAPGWYKTSLFSTPSFGSASIDNALRWAVSFFADKKPLEQVVYAVRFLRILMSFILFLSTSALLAGALQAAHHFFIPAFSQVLLNVFYISGLATCLFFGLSPVYLCLFIMAGGLAQLIAHGFMYARLGFRLGVINGQTWTTFKGVWHKFLPCLFAMSVTEIYLFIDTSLGSYIPGSIPLIYYANRFMQIPLGVVATALSTILLPYFSRIGVYAPKRLGFFLLEATKLMMWVMIPFALLMAFISDKIFLTLFISKKFSVAQGLEASVLLVAFLYGLLFFSLNKILLNMFYALHETKIPMYISIAATITNFIISYTLMSFWGAYGIALGTTVSGILQTFLYIFFLGYRFKFTFYVKQFGEFLARFGMQLGLIIGIFLITYSYIAKGLGLLPDGLASFFLNKVGFWLWLCPLAASMFGIMLFTRKLFSIRLYFLD